MTVAALHAKKKKALLNAIIFSTLLAAGSIGIVEGILFLSSMDNSPQPQGTTDPPRPMVTVLHDEVVIINEYRGQ